MSSTLRRRPRRARMASAAFAVSALAVSVSAVCASAVWASAREVSPVSPLPLDRPPRAKRGAMGALATFFEPQVGQAPSPASAYSA